MENKRMKRNEMFMAFKNETSRNENECSLVYGYPPISFVNHTAPKSRLHRLKKLIEENYDQPSTNSSLTAPEEESFQAAVEELEKKLLIEKETSEWELNCRIREARQEERKTIGFELHDNVNQILATAKLFVEMFAPSTDQDRVYQAKSSELIRKAYEEIKKISRKLADPTCPDNSLCNELQQLTEELRLSKKYIVQFEHDFNEEFVSPLARINLYRIAQEQLKNILEYSQAKNIIISLKELNGQLLFCIADDGIGFDQSTYRKGLGHITIGQRVETLNGEVEFKTEQGKGCSLLVTIPITNK